MNGLTFSTFLITALGHIRFLWWKVVEKHPALAVTAVSQAIGLGIGVTIVLVSTSWIKPDLSWGGYFLPGIMAGSLGFIGLVAFTPALQLVEWALLLQLVQ